MKTITGLLFFAFVLLNCGITYLSLQSRPSDLYSTSQHPNPTPYYIHPPFFFVAYIGKDYPITYPTHHQKPLAPVGLTLQNSIHFTLNTTLTPSLQQTWKTITTHPLGLGRIHLGPEKRLFVTAFYHQLHCLRMLQQGILDRKHWFATREHVQHCLSYLRQTFLCAAADGLEGNDFMEWEEEGVRGGATGYAGGMLVCRDWEEVYRRMGQSWEEWEVWKVKKGIL